MKPSPVICRHSQARLAIDNIPVQALPGPARKVRLQQVELQSSSTAPTKLHSQRLLTPQRQQQLAVRAPPTGLYHLRRRSRQGSAAGTPGKGKNSNNVNADEIAKQHAVGQAKPGVKEADTYTTRAKYQDVSDKQSMIASPALISCSACGIAFGPPFIWILKLNSL